MPCYTISEVRAELSVADPEILLRALKAAGYQSITAEAGIIAAATPEGRLFQIRAGQVQMYGLDQRAVEDEATRITKAYGAEVIRTAAKRYGFALKQNPKQPTQFTLKRRSL
jgi:hypothetical protein